MTSSVRYKFVKNSTAAPITLANFPVLNDGDDKQVKFVRHVLTADDIGVGAGQVGNAEGLILDFVTLNYNILWIQGISYRNSATTGGGTRLYFIIDNSTIGATESNIQYGKATDGTIRVVDGAQGTEAALGVGDVITAMIIIGIKVDDRDSM